MTRDLPIATCRSVELLLLLARRPDTEAGFRPETGLDQTQAFVLVVASCCLFSRIAVPVHTSPYGDLTPVPVRVRNLARRNRQQAPSELHPSVYPSLPSPVILPDLEEYSRREDRNLLHINSKRCQSTKRPSGTYHR